MSRTRQSASNKPATNQQIQVHRKDDNSDHGRNMPQRSRIPLSSGRNLGGIDEFVTPGYVPYWARESDVPKFMQAGYEHVKDNKGENIKRASGGSYLVLMQQPEEWHKEDKELLKKRSIAGLNESATINSNKGEYTSNQSGHSIQKDTGVNTEDLLG